MTKKLKLAEGISKPLVINSDYTYKVDVKLTKDGTKDGKQLFFGIKKNNSIDNELDDTYNKYIQSEPQVEGCVVQLYDSPYSNGKSIVYNLSENTTGSERLLTFSYNGTVLFKIKQAAKALEYNSEYVYVCTVSNISNGPNKIWLFAILTENSRVPNKSDLLNSYKTMVQFDSSYAGDNRKNGRTLYFSEKTLPANKTIQELKNSGVLTVVRENKVMYDTDIPYHLVLVNNNAYNAPYNIQSNIEDAFKTPYEMYVINQNDTVSSYQKTIFNIFDYYYCGIYKFNSNVNKKTYTIYMFKVLTSQFTSHGNNAFLFVPTSDMKYTSISIENADIDRWGYTSFPVRDDENKLYTYFFVETTNTLTIDKLSGKTLKELKDNYNLTKVSGNMYEDDDAYVNNISDKVLVNEWKTIIHKTLNKNTALNDSVAKAWLYASNGSMLYTNATSSNSVIIDMNNPAGIYNITV